MRTTLDLPKELIDEAQTSLGFKSKTDTIIFALRELIRRQKLDELVSLVGKLDIEVDTNLTRGRSGSRQN